MNRKLVVFLLVLLASIAVFPGLIPATGESSAARLISSSPPAHTPAIFSSRLAGRSSRQITQVTVPDLFSFQVVEQPANNPAYVSSAADTLTHFRTAEKYGTIGILAHNHLAGAQFFDLILGDRIDLVMAEEDGGQAVRSFWVFSIREFQAASPNSPYSEFIDLKTDQRYSASQLFLEIYGNDGLLVLQTCLSRDGVDSWGRIFVIASPVPASFYKPWTEDLDLALLH